MQPRQILILSILSLLLAACAATNSPVPTLVTPDTHSIPTPASTFIEQFIWQTDGLCGYRMLRPERWSASESECRAYVPTDSQGESNQLTLQSRQLSSDGATANRRHHCPI